MGIRYNDPYELHNNIIIIGNVSLASGSFNLDYCSKV